MAIGLLVLRLVIGGLMMGHGAQMLLGWLGGGGFRNTAVGFEKLGFTPGYLMAVVAGLTEAGAGALLGCGFLTALASAMLIGVMINAGSVHAHNGLWITSPGMGFEYNLVLASIGATFAFSGAGRYSLDSALGITASGGRWGLLAVGIGVATGAASVLRRYSVLRTRARNATGVSGHLLPEAAVLPIDRV